MQHRCGKRSEVQAASNMGANVLFCRKWDSISYFDRLRESRNGENNGPVDLGYACS